jgi:hypothetical protein
MKDGGIYDVSKFIVEVLRLLLNFLSCSLYLFDFLSFVRNGVQERCRLLNGIEFLLENSVCKKRDPGR